MRAPGSQWQAMTHSGCLAEEDMEGVEDWGTEVAAGSQDGMGLTGQSWKQKPVDAACVRPELGLILEILGVYLGLNEV